MGPKWGQPGRSYAVAIVLQVTMRRVVRLPGRRRGCAITWYWRRLPAGLLSTDIAVLKVVKRVGCRGDVIEFVVKEIGVRVRRHGNGGVAHRLLQQAKVRTCSAGQRRVGVPEIVLMPTSA
jgi:hypothetical protein